mmetsp:Transcript_68428/g.164296  ORF Transcript_68428/g.164296 Transcript_68428/m.164296 type:complete len:243 (-) Transcript_68428:64-792(-)
MCFGDVVRMLDAHILWIQPHRQLILDFLRSNVKEKKATFNIQRPIVGLLWKSLRQPLSHRFVAPRAPLQERVYVDELLALLERQVCLGLNMKSVVEDRKEVIVLLHRVVLRDQLRRHTLKEGKDDELRNLVELSRSLPQLLPLSRWWRWWILLFLLLLLHSLQQRLQQFLFYQHRQSQEHIGLLVQIRMDTGAFAIVTKTHKHRHPILQSLCTLLGCFVGSFRLHHLCCSHLRLCQLRLHCC